MRLLRAVRVVEVDLRRRLRAEFGETLPRFDVMAALARQKTGMTMTEVSRFLMVSNGNVTGIIDRLVTEGLVVRIADAQDRRATLVRLTPKGLRHFARMAEAHEGWVNEILARFSSEQSQALIGSLDTLTAATRSGVKATMTAFKPKHFNWRIDGGVAVISLARPERKNPLTFDSYAELRDTFRALTAADDVKAVVIASNGGNFSSGGDGRLPDPGARRRAARARSRRRCRAPAGRAR